MNLAIIRPIHLAPSATGAALFQSGAQPQVRARGKHKGL